MTDSSWSPGVENSESYLPEETGVADSSGETTPDEQVAKHISPESKEYQEIKSRLGRLLFGVWTHFSIEGVLREYSRIKKTEEELGVAPGLVESDSEVQKTARWYLLAAFTRYHAVTIVKAYQFVFSIGDEIFREPEYQIAARNNVRALLYGSTLLDMPGSGASNDDRFNQAREICELFGWSTSEVKSVIESELQDEAKKAILNKLQSVWRTSDLVEVKKIIDNRGVNESTLFQEPEFQEAGRMVARQALGRCIEAGLSPGNDNLALFRQLRTMFNIPAGEIESDPEMQGKAKDYILRKLRNGDSSMCIHIQDIFLVSDDFYASPECQELAMGLLEMTIDQSYRHNIIIDKFKFLREKMKMDSPTFAVGLRNYLFRLKGNGENIDTKKLIDIVDPEIRVAGIGLDAIRALPFTAGQLKQISRQEAGELEQYDSLIRVMEICYFPTVDEIPLDFDLSQDLTDGRVEEVCRQSIINSGMGYSVEPLIDQGFKSRDLLRFASRERLSRHDAFLAGSSIALLYEQSELTPTEFTNQILLQVTMDDSGYESGTANHHFNTLANRGLVPLAGLEATIDTYSPGEQDTVRQMIAEFQTSRDIFASWRSMKAYYAKCNLIIGNREQLVRVSELKQAGKTRLADWYWSVASSSIVDTNALLEFLTSPDQFFDRSASYTTDSMHDAKKPTNYYHVPNLDLTAEELRDSLVEGAIDRIAAIPPHEVQYEIAPNGKYFRDEVMKLPMVQRLNLYLGSRKNGVEGLAENSQKLFHAVSQILKTHGLSVPDVLTGAVVMAEDVASQVITALEATPIKDYMLVDCGKRYYATIYEKSNPNGVLAGNDTACCMPFGDGKANVYLMNPACSQFTIQSERDDGTRRTLVQSVMTLNIPVPGHTVPELTELLSNAENTNLSEILPDEAMLVTQQALLVGDNAQASPNFLGSEHAGEFTRMAYEDFFARYFNDIELGNVRRNEVQIGMGYSDILKELPHVRNETVPVAPMSYSDNLHPESYQLTPRLALYANMRIVTMPERQPEGIRYASVTGVSSLTYLDSLPCAYLESKAYRGTTLLEGMHNMENGLIAKDINNAAKNRADLSVKYIGNDKKLHSYLLAYEGKWGVNAREQRNNYGDQYDDQEMGENGSAARDVEPCIYIADFASDREGTSAGYALREFCLRYKSAYLDRGNPLPIYAEMRESTSYQLLLNHRALISRWLGTNIAFEEVDLIEESGDERRHVVRLTAEPV